MTGTKILISDSVLRSIPGEKIKIGKQVDAHLAGKEGSTLLTEVLGFTEMDSQLELQASLKTDSVPFGAPLEYNPYADRNGA